MKSKNKIFKIVEIVLMCVCLFLGGFFLGKSSFPLFFSSKINEKETLHTKVDLSIFWQVWDIIRQKYKDADKLDDQKMIYGSVSGLVDSLGDPYSEFMTPDLSKRFLEDIKGTFEGIGAEIGINKNNKLTIIAPLEGTPAQRSGLKSGDEIIQIDNKITTDMTLEEAVSLIRGEKGTRVKLIILRADNSKEQEINVTRDTIKVPVVSVSILNDDIAHIRLFNFTENSPQEFGEISQKVLQSSAKRILLDLRGNPGGYLDAAVDIAGWFLDTGDVVVIEDQGKLGQKKYFANGRSVFKNWPMVILIDSGSASASEILAGALRDNLKTKLIGVNSFGKGSVQEMVNLDKGASLKITVANWLTPTGISISKAGLKPDIEVETGSSDTIEKQDLQLEKAINILKSY
ncbi:MAG: S41 family peptidase [Candidatus Paceibacterota bacterium]|jgi:carboxyl-terminal processing protease